MRRGGPALGMTSRPGAPRVSSSTTVTPSLAAKQASLPSPDATKEIVREVPDEKSTVVTENDVEVIRVKHAYRWFGDWKTLLLVPRKTRTSEGVVFPIGMRYRSRLLPSLTCGGHPDLVLSTCAAMK